MMLYGKSPTWRDPGIMLVLRKNTFLLIFQFCTQNQTKNFTEKICLYLDYDKPTGVIKICLYLDYDKPTGVKNKKQIKNRKSEQKKPEQFRAQRYKGN